MVYYYDPSLVLNFCKCMNFCCRETWEKVNIQFNKNSTLSFNQRKTYVFDEASSSGSEDDVVVVPNIPMLVSSMFYKILV